MIPNVRNCSWVHASGEHGEDVLLGHESLERHGDHGGVLGGASIQSHTAHLRAGRVSLVRPGRGRAQPAGRERQDRHRHDDMESARVRHPHGQVRRRHTREHARLAQRLRLAQGSHPQRGGPQEDRQGQGAATHRRKTQLHNGPISYW